MKVALTFDTDWAPDYVLEHVFEILHSYDLPATFFFTNQTRIAVPNSVEVGLHPDFRAGSPQGRSTEEILDNMLEWFPDAIGIRNHRWYWDYCGSRLPMLVLLVQNRVVHGRHVRSQNFLVRCLRRPSSSGLAPRAEGLQALTMKAVRKRGASCA